MAPKYETISSAHLATGRAVDQLRRQLGIVFQSDTGAPCGACPVEGLSESLFAELARAKLSLLLTGARARSLGLAVTGDAVRVDADTLSLATVMALADPLSDTPLPAIKQLSDHPAQSMLLTLAKYAALLPAMLLVESDALPQSWLPVAAKDVESYWANPPLDIVPLASAALPNEYAENATLTCFRQRFGTSVHLAMIIGDITKTPAPLVRVHSSCVTGDILESLRCDCGGQLALALRQIASEGAGILLYLHQEGRGIGIANKLRAYALQERGIDTYEANLMLGFGEDERDFAIGAAILKKLGVNTIRMLTNNPKKLASLEKSGIKVSDRVPLLVDANEHSHAYLDAKAKAGHVF